MDVLSVRHFVRTGVDVLSGRRFVRTSLNILSGPACLQRFVRKTFFQDHLKDFVRKVFCQDRLTGGHRWLQVVMGGYWVITVGLGLLRVVRGGYDKQWHTSNKD